MENKYSNFTDEELLVEKKKMNKNNIFIAFVIGICIGISVYSLVLKGVGVYSFLPLFLAFLFYKGNKKNTALLEELQNRNLN